MNNIITKQVKKNLVPTAVHLKPTDELHNHHAVQALSSVSPRCTAALAKLSESTRNQTRSNYKTIL